MSSPFMEQNRSLFSRFSEQLRSTPVLQVAVMAAAPAAAMIMGGAGLDSYEASQVLQNEGVEAYRALKAAVGDMSAVEAIKTAMTGGFETVGRNISFGGMARYRSYAYHSFYKSCLLLTVSLKLTGAPRCGTAS